MLLSRRLAFIDGQPCGTMLTVISRRTKHNDHVVDDQIDVLIINLRDDSSDSSDDADEF